MSVYMKLALVQGSLKAPKGQYNSFGKYKYRSAEDILEALKPCLLTEGATVIISDEVVLIGDRYYVKATATFVDIEDGASVSNTALAREDDNKKGMDGSQITGTASSYARKYALNGLFLIDDTKDADTDEHHNELLEKAKKSESKAKEEQKPSNPNTKAQEELGGKIEPLQETALWLHKGDVLFVRKSDGNYIPAQTFSASQLQMAVNDSRYNEIAGELMAIMATKK